MVKRLFAGRGTRQEALVSGVDGRVDRLVACLCGRSRVGLRFQRNIGHELRDALFGAALGAYREFLIVALAVLGVTEYAAGMIDEPERFFDVALSVAGLRVILPDQATQCRAHVLVRGCGRDSQCFVERRFHGPRAALRGEFRRWNLRLIGRALQAERRRLHRERFMLVAGRQTLPLRVT